MMREAMIAIIRERARGMALKDLQRYVKHLPAQVEPGAMQFCTDNDFGPWFAAQMIVHKISAAYELQQLVLERKQAEKQAKGVKNPGDNSHDRA